MPPSDRENIEALTSTANSLSRVADHDQGPDRTRRDACERTISTSGRHSVDAIPSRNHDRQATAEFAGTA